MTDIQKRRILSAVILVAGIAVLILTGVRDKHKKAPLLESSLPDDDRESRLDEGLQETFPASDPVSI